jgi:hypothetical protein
MHKELLYAFAYSKVLLALLTPWPVVRKQTTPTERPPLVDEI